MIRIVLFHRLSGDKETSFSSIFDQSLPHDNIKEDFFCTIENDDDSQKRNIYRILFSKVSINDRTHFVLHRSSFIH